MGKIPHSTHNFHANYELVELRNSEHSEEFLKISSAFCFSFGSDLFVYFSAMDKDTPKWIADLLDSLSRQDEIVAANIVGPGLPLGEMLDFSNQQMQPYTETSYVPD